MDWRADRIGSALRGENPMVMARMRSGFAVIGDTQHLPGYSVLLSDDGEADQLTDLPWERRAEFLFDLGLLGEAVQTACRPQGLRRVNYEILGNSWPHLHGHVHPRYAWEPAERAGWPVWCYPDAAELDERHPYDEAEHGPVRAAITRELERLMAAAYGGS